MQPSATHFMSEEAFFEFIRTRDEKWELRQGEAVMMAPSDQRHQNIAANALASLHTQLRGKKCRPTTANTGVATTSGTVRYPDVVVDCGRRDDQSMVATEPTVVIEVLSSTTRGFDSHRKVFEYKSKPEITFILLIDTNSACVLLHYREGKGWGETIHDDLDDVIILPRIGAGLSLSEIYEGVGGCLLELWSEGLRE